MKILILFLILFLLYYLIKKKESFNEIECMNVHVDKFFLLTLKKSENRRNNFLKRFNNLKTDIPLEIIWGVDTTIPKNAEPYRDLINPYNYKIMYDLDSGKRKRTKGSDFNSGAFGAFLGHTTFYKKCFEEHLKYAIIFEDNVLLEPSFINELNQALTNIPKDFDVCLFHYNNKISTTIKSCKSTIEKILSFESGKCYLINVEGLKKYYNLFFPMDNHFDAKYKDLIEKGANVYLIPLKSIKIDYSTGSVICHSKIYKESFGKSAINYENIKNKKINNIFSNITFISINDSIPNIIHKIYIDNTMTLNNIDPTVKKLFVKTQKLNPGYTLKVWSGDDCLDYLKKHFSKDHVKCFNGLKPYAFKADFMRYCILYNEGGWYSDLKEDPLISYDKINNKNYSFIGIVDLGMEYTLDNFCLQNAFFACIPKHPLLKICINQVITNFKNRFYGKHYLDPTGPRLFGNELEKIRSMPDNVLMGYFIHDIPGGSHHLNNQRTIIHKCNNCVQGNEWKYGNNWQRMWLNKKIY